MSSRVILAVVCSGLVLWACDDDGTRRAKAASDQGASAADEAGDQGRQAAPAAQPDPEQARIEAEFPLHGLVTGLQLVVRAEPHPEGHRLGWLRIGSRVRLAPGPTKTSTCATGWHRVYPTGWACAGEGIEVSDEPRESEIATTPPARDAPLPYTYYFVKEPLVAEYHRLPSRDEQRAASAFVDHYLELLEEDEDRASKLLQGELNNAPAPPAVVRKYLHRGFFVAGTGIASRALRKFVRGVRGGYVKHAQVLEREPSGFQGVTLGEEHQLPVAWAVRAARPFEVKTRDDGSLRMIANPDEEPYERHAILPWAKRTRIGTRLLHELDDGRYLKHWFVAVAERIDRPGDIGDDEPWVHVDLEQQTLVAYRGDTPVYATLVSSGLEDHETPTGTFEIHTKYVADTMSDLGPDAGDDRYRIEDVPWTQYFKGSLALHGAFWHGRFGLRRSHGCINLSPRDAHEIFNHTWPEIPPGWHGVSTDQTDFKASKIVITD